MGLKTVSSQPELTDGDAIPNNDATSISTSLETLSNKIDTLANKIDIMGSKIDTLSNTINTKFDTVITKIDILISKISDSNVGKVLRPISNHNEDKYAKLLRVFGKVIHWITIEPYISWLVFKEVLTRRDYESLRAIVTTKDKIFLLVSILAGKPLEMLKTIKICAVVNSHFEFAKLLIEQGF